MDLQGTVESIFKNKYSILMNHPPLYLCKFNTFMWLKGTIKITHPYTFNEYGSSHDKVTVMFEGETLNGKPHGLCYLDYEGDNDYEALSFRGMGMMREGELHGGPACFVRGDGHR